MNNAIFNLDYPTNEVVRSYVPGSRDRKILNDVLDKLSKEIQDIPLIIGGREVRTGKTGRIVMPHNHNHVIGNYQKAGEAEVQMAIDAALAAHDSWSSLSWVERVSITLRVAELISKNIGIF